MPVDAEGRLTPDTPPPDWAKKNHAQVAFEHFCSRWSDDLAGLTGYISLRRFWDCATGQVHPDEVADYFTHQLELI